jgi:plasmid stabilization system protein ParE
VARRLVLTRAAERDVAEQVDYIAKEPPAAARRYLAAVSAAYDRLLDVPEVGVVRSFPVPGYEVVRMWPVPGFRRPP